MGGFRMNLERFWELNLYIIEGFKALMADWIFWATKEEREHQGRSNDLVSRSNHNQYRSNDMAGRLNDLIDSNRFLPFPLSDLIVSFW